MHWLRRRPYLVSVLYLLHFTIVVLISGYWLIWCMLQDPDLWWFYGLDLVFLGALFIFAMHVATKKKIYLGTSSSNKKRGSTAVQLYAGEQTEFFKHEDATVGVLSKSTNMSICFVSLISATDQTILKMLWPDRCPKKHGLMLYQTTNGLWTCDVCSTSLQRETTVWYCKTCNWGKCVVCSPCVTVTHGTNNIISMSVGSVSMCTPCDEKWAVEISL